MPQSRTPRGVDTDVGRLPRQFLLLVAIAVALRVALFPLFAWLPNGYFDETAWKYWMEQIHQHGVLNIFRTTTTDYVGFHWILWLLSIVYAWIGGPYTATTPSLHVLVKVPPLVFDVALMVTVYAATATLVRGERTDRAAAAEGRARQPARTRRGAWTDARVRRLALAAAAVIAFQPAVVYDSAVWAQTDAAVTAAMLGSLVLAARGRPATGWMVWTLGFLLKPQPVIIVPVLLLVTLRGGGVRAIGRSLLGSAAVAGVVLGPWIAHGDGGRIAGVYHGLFLATYPRLSAGAWNLWWFWDLNAAHHSTLDPVPGMTFLTYRMAGGALSLAAAGVAFAYAWMRPGLRGALVAAAYLAFAFYVVPVSTHDRYLYPFFGLLLPVAMLERRWLWLYAPASAVFFANLFASAPPLQSLSGQLVDQRVTLWFAGFNLALFAAFTLTLAWGALPRRRTAARTEERQALAGATATDSARP